MVWTSKLWQFEFPAIFHQKICFRVTADKKRGKFKLSQFWSPYYSLLDFLYFSAKLGLKGISWEGCQYSIIYSKAQSVCTLLLSFCNLPMLSLKYPVSIQFVPDLFFVGYCLPQLFLEKARSMFYFCCIISTILLASARPPFIHLVFLWAEDRSRDTSVWKSLLFW